MKKLILNLAMAILLLPGSMTLSCQSNVDQNDAAENKVQESANGLMDPRASEKLEAEKVASSEAWKMFRNDSEAKIRDIESRIAGLRMKLQVPGKALDAHVERRINELEQKITDLISRLDSYDYANRNDLESFRREFNHDLEEVGRAVKNFTMGTEQ